MKLNIAAITPNVDLEGTPKNIEPTAANNVTKKNVGLKNNKIMARQKSAIATVP